MHSVDRHAGPAGQKRSLHFGLDGNQSAIRRGRPAYGITLRNHIYAAMAEEERRKISHRTRAALAVNKIQLAKEGRKLGNPDPLKALALANAAKQRATPPAEVLSLMLRLREEKKSLWAIAGELNRLGIRTGRGSRWYASTERLQLRAVRQATQ